MASCTPTSEPELRTIATRSTGDFDVPRDLQFHPIRTNELWIANKGSADVTIVTFGGDAGSNAFNTDMTTYKTFGTERLSDRAKYHYMAQVSSLSFTPEGRFATCQESTNTYEGLTAKGGENGNKFMGPTLFESKVDRRVTSMGRLSCDSSKETCFLRHIDMLHESPFCMGIVHDSEEYECPGRATMQKNVFWAFDGFGRGGTSTTTTTTTTTTTGMLMRYDFERAHGGCNSYLCADHGEAEVRRYEDVVLTRMEGIVSHMAMDGRDIWVADTGGHRLLRVDADSGRSDRTAIYDFPIYSSTHLHFNYKIWNCTRYESVLDATTPSMLVEDAANFMPSGVVVTGGIIYVSNHATGNILAVDKYHGIVVRTLKTNRPFALAGLEIRKGNSGHLFVLDQKKEVLLRIAQTFGCGDGGGKPRRPYPVAIGQSAAVCGAASAATDTIATVGAAIVHDPGYMNVAIPFDYGMDTSIPCHDSAAGKSNFNLDALLMAGHTCHRCLPEPCHNGGQCAGVQESGFTCTCKTGFTGDVCQIDQRAVPDDAKNLAPSSGGGVLEEEKVQSDDVKGTDNESLSVGHGRPSLGCVALLVFLASCML